MSSQSGRTAPQSHPAVDATAGAPRCIGRRDIERTYGFKPAVFSRLVGTGLMPSRLPGTRLWDRVAIERALDTLSGLQRPAPDAGDTTENVRSLL
jgi:hypothetical protein